MFIFYPFLTHSEKWNFTVLIILYPFAPKKLTRMSNLVQGLELFPKFMPW